MQEGDIMKWIDNKYADVNGRIVAEIDPRDEASVFAFDETATPAKLLGRYATAFQAKQAIEQWWHKHAESLRP